MADEQEPQSAAPQQPAATFSGLNFGAPTVFAEMVANIQITNNAVVKFYLVRQDPDPLAPQETHVVTAAQVAMPIEGFVLTTLFFMDRLQSLIDTGLVSQEFVDQMGGSAVAAPPEPAEPDVSE